MKEVGSDGPTNASILIVGEAPGADEERLGKPFVGTSGQELDRMLGEAGISRAECRVTNVCRIRPPNNDISKFFARSKKEITSEHIKISDKFVLPIIKRGLDLLATEVQLVKPNIILALGNTSLWALTGRWGITKWRGSMLHSDMGGFQVIPTIHPAAVLREWAWRSIVVRDLRRAARFRTAKFPIPAWSFIIKPGFSVVQGILSSLLHRLEKEVVWIDFDLETKYGHIDCAGISWSSVDALCIPFIHDYWTVEQEAWIIQHLRRLLLHKRVCVRGQNLLYDSQYTYKWWGYVPRVMQDTMLSHHTAFCGMRKSLDFQASLYCDEYKQWKPDKSAWKEGG